MMKKLCITMVMSGLLSFAQTSEDCFYGTISETTSNGANITTGGLYEYTAASDFDVPFGTIFTVEQFKFNIFKGEMDLDFVHIYILAENQGKPGEVLHSLENLVPDSQDFAYTTGIEDMDAYQITVNVPSTFDLTRGKYYIQLQGAPGDGITVSWEIGTEETSSLGRFDFSKFDNDDWFGGSSYYDYIFEVLGICSDSGEELPNYGEECVQGNESNNHETGLNIAGLTVADDFIVAENTTFYLNTFKITTLQLGNILNATITIRESENDMPGDLIYTVENKGPKTENYFGYWPLEGSPLDVVAVDLEFEFETPIELTAGRYFIDIQATPFPFSDILLWEATSLPGIGGDGFVSYDNGTNWEEAEGYNMVFDLFGYCMESLGTNDPESQAYLKYYPNPVQNELHIESIMNVENIYVYNITGHLILQSKVINGKLNTASLTSGLYLLKAEMENGNIIIFKIIKE